MKSILGVGHLISSKLLQEEAGDKGIRGVEEAALTLCAWWQFLPISKNDQALPTRAQVIKRSLPNFFS
jgi:hypothetical protein